jgi:hypothetical protein
MLTSHKIFVAVSLTVFTLFFQGYILTNYSLFSTLDTFNKIFTVVFPFVMPAFLWCLLEQAKLKWQTILKIMVVMVLFNMALGAVLVKFTSLTDIYISREYSKLNEEFLKANPAVVDLPLYIEFKNNMDKLDPVGFGKAKKQYYDIKSVDEYMSDLIRITTNNSNLAPLKVKLAEIDSDHYISMEEYQSFINVANTLPESKESQVYKNIYSKLR